MTASADPCDSFLAVLTRVAARLTPCSRTVTALRRAGDVRLVPRRGHLQRQGEVAHHVHFVAQGLLRTYSADADGGDERTRQFFDEGRVFADMASLARGEAATQGIKAVEASVVLRLPWSALQAAYDAAHAFERFGRLMVEEAVLGSQRRATNLLTLTPEHRYQTFPDTRPEVARRLPQYLIASYLGITPEALSRIRARRGRTTRMR